MEKAKKYELTDNVKTHYGHVLHRIKALKNFGNNVKAGDLGGWVESEDNLSQVGDCWVYGEANVYGCAKVYDKAKVCGNALVFGGAEVYGCAWVCGNAKVYDNARVYDYALVFGNTRVYDYAKVYGNAAVCGDANVYGNAEVYDDAYADGNVAVSGHAIINENAAVFGNASIYNAKVSNVSDYIVFKNWWSSGRYFTWTRSNNLWKVGCFYGTGEELVAKAYADSASKGKEYEKVVNYVKTCL